jgi:hypothetical protein
VEFDELVCYSQTAILIVLGIGYLVNIRNKTEKPKLKAKNICPICDYIISDQSVNYCAKCGNMVSHSKGLSLKK